MSTALFAVGFGGNIVRAIACPMTFRVGLGASV